MKHVLIIDDNDMDIFVAKYVLNKSQKVEKIISKNSAISALEYLEDLKGNPEEFPDIIFLDIRMPEIDGFGFLEKFVKLTETENIQCPIVMLSSSNDETDIKQAMEYTVVRKFFTKPLTLEMLGILEGI